MNFNKCILGGNLTKDPALSYTPNQTAVCNTGIAVNRKWKSKDGGDKAEVCFIDLVSFGKTAENINKYCHKGDPIFIEGRLTLDSWTSQDGTKRSKHKVTVDNFQFLGGKKTDQNASERNEPEQSTPEQGKPVF